MIEQKNTPPQPPADKRQKLRSWWAQVQCRTLLRRHSMRGVWQSKAEAAVQYLASNPVLLTLGEVFYVLGFCTEYAFVRAGRWVRDVFLALVAWAGRFAHELGATAFPGAARVLEELIGPFYILFRGICRLLVRAHQIRCQQGLRAALKISGSYLAAGIRHNLERLPRLAMYLLPMAAAGAMWVVVSTVVQRPYALAVQVNGETVGYVANEDVFNSARDAVQQRINYAGTEKTEWTIEPAYTVGVAHDVMDENSMADAILRTSDDQISEGTALYLDGQLTAVCEEGVQLQSFLSSLLAPYEQEDDPNVTVGFNHSIELENGIYFNESFQDYNQVKELLTKVQQQQKLYKVLTGDTLWEIAQKNNLTMKELCALNPNFKGAPLSQDSSIMPGDELVITKEESLLEVQITKTVTWKEEIPYAIEKTKSNEYTVGTTKTLQEGQNGLRAVTAQNIYDTDGMLLEQTILGSETLQEPVTKKVVVGTKKITNKTTFITGSGQFIWPVPGYSYCSRWFGGSHRGVDICASAGTPIYASAGGTVAKAGYNRAGAGSNYGYSIIINHAGGYKTVYAHCLSLVVSAGQTVKQGQLIGYVGSTGKSSGNHCHFEIRSGNKYIPPQNVFNRGSYRNR